MPSPRSRAASLRAVVNVVDRGNVYFVARKGMRPRPASRMTDFFKGKSDRDRLLRRHAEFDHALSLKTLGSIARTMSR